MPTNHLTLTPVSGVDTRLHICQLCFSTFTWTLTHLVKKGRCRCHLTSVEFPLLNITLVRLFFSPFLFLSGTKKYGLHLVSLQDLTCLPVLLSCHRRGFTEESPQLNSDGNTSNITKSAVWWLYDSSQLYHMVAMVQTLTQILFIIIIIITITTLL